MFRLGYTLLAAAFLRVTHGQQTETDIKSTVQSLSSDDCVSR
jgi:hypothetical protein